MAADKQIHSHWYSPVKLSVRQDEQAVAETTELITMLERQLVTVHNLLIAPERRSRHKQS